MSKVSLVLRPDKKNGKGLIPIYLRVYEGGKQRYKATGHFIPEKHWDDRTEVVRTTWPAAEELNIDLLYRKGLALRALSRGGDAEEAASGRDLRDLFQFADKHIEDVRGKREAGTLENYRKHLLKLENYLGDRRIRFDELTHEKLLGLEKYMRGKGVSHRTVPDGYIHAVMKTIRRIFNAARREGITDAYPFSRYEMPEQRTGDKEHLTLEELDRWEAYVDGTKDPEHYQAGSWFLLGCYSGLRISDWQGLDLQKRVQGGLLALRARKNKEWVRVPVFPRLERATIRCKGCPLTMMEPHINRVLKEIARAVKIDKHLTSHCARKTFAVTMCLERGMRSEEAAELMGITLAVFVKSYSKITAQALRKAAEEAWSTL